MFAMPQLRLIFLSLFISSVLLPMEYVTPEVYCESDSSDEEDIVANGSKKSLNPQANKAIIRNVSVARQNPVGASCGYHSILNSILSLPGMNKNELNEIRVKFSQKDGEWRAFIIKMRKEKLVKSYITNLLHRYMLRNTTEQLRKLNDNENRALDRIANAYAKAFVSDETLNILQENPKNLEGQLQEIVKGDQPNIEDKEVQSISRCIKMIDFTKLSITIAHAHQLIEQARTNAKGSNLETDLFGDNLNTEEMEALKDFALEKYGITDNCITIIDDTNALKNEAYQDILNPAKKQMLGKDCIHSFCIRTSDKSAYNQQEIDQLNNIIHGVKATQKEKDAAERKQTEINRKLSANTKSTHWISVILDRKNGKSSYLLKDSTGKDYTKHHNVLQLIELLAQLKHNAQADPINVKSTSKSSKENLQEQKASVHPASSDNDKVHLQQNNPIKNPHINSKNEPKIPAKKNPIYSSDSDDSSEDYPIKFTEKRSSYSKSSKPKRNFCDEKTPTYGEQPYQPKGRYNNPKLVDTEYDKELLESAPDHIKLLLHGLKRPKQAARMGCLKNLLLHGQPGNGKTSLAKAMALDVYGKYYFIPTPYLLTSWKNCHTDLLLEINPLIEKGEPIVIIFDEIDELSNQYKNHNSSDASMPKAFCLLLDYCKENAPFLFIIGTTNNEPDDFLPALLSRFGSNIVLIPYPNALTRSQIVNAQLINTENNLTDNDKALLVEQLEGRSCRDIIDILEQSILYSFRIDNIVTLELINSAREKNPLQPSKYQRLAQRTNSTEAEVKETIADKTLLEQNHEVVDFIIKKKGIELQKEGLEQGVTHQEENKKQHKENIDRQNKHAAYQAFSNVKMKSKDCSVQINDSVSLGSGVGINFGRSQTYHPVNNDHYEAAKNSLPDEQKEFFEEAQAKCTAAEAQAADQAQQNQNQKKQSTATVAVEAVLGAAWTVVGAGAVVVGGGLSVVAVGAGIGGAIGVGSAVVVVGAGTGAVVVGAKVVGVASDVVVKGVSKAKEECMIQ